MKNVIIGLLFVFGGVFAIWLTYKNPSDKDDAMKSDAKGYLGGIIAIIVGIMTLIGKINW